MLSKYTAHTNRSFAKLTHSSIRWLYYSFDPEWRSLQATHLVMELKAELSSFDLRFVALKVAVEIVPRRLNKGLIVKKDLQEVAANNGDEAVDFIDIIFISTLFSFFYTLFQITLFLRLRIKREQK